MSIVQQLLGSEGKGGHQQGAKLEACQWVEAMLQWKKTIRGNGCTHHHLFQLNKQLGPLVTKSSIES